MMFASDCQAGRVLRTREKKGMRDQPMSHVNWAVPFELIREMAEPSVGQPRPNLITNVDFFPDWNIVA